MLKAKEVKMAMDQERESIRRNFEHLEERTKIEKFNK